MTYYIILFISEIGACHKKPKTFKTSPAYVPHWLIFALIWSDPHYVIVASRMWRH